MFISGTPIFTDSGWKNVEEISGRDKVLVRNFLGDAEFIQPFALKKKHYDGEVIKIGARDWSFTVTPDHQIVYEDGKLRRKFKYMFSDEPKKEMIKIKDEFGQRHVSISDYDWYKLVAYVLARGFIRKKPGKPMLWFFLDEDKMEQEIVVLGDILDRIGLPWHVQYSEKTRAKLVVSSRNTLARRLMTRLGSSTRKTMYLPDKMIYSSSKELRKLLIETFIEASTTTGKRVQIVTTNKKLVDSLILFGTLGGYSMVGLLKDKAGKTTIRGTSKKDSYILVIFDQTELYSPKFSKKLTYSGYVYGIDLFEGQVYIKEGSVPIWIHPK